MSGAVTWSDIEHRLEEIRNSYAYLKAIGLSGEYLEALLRLRNWDKGPRGYLHNTPDGKVYRLIIDGYQVKFQVRRSYEHVSNYTDVLETQLNIKLSDIYDTFTHLLMGFKELQDLHHLITMNISDYDAFMDGLGKLEPNIQRIAHSQLDDDATLTDGSMTKVDIVSRLHNALRRFWMERTGTWS